MAWPREGDYVASFSCDVVCPCPHDGRPTDMDDVDLTGVSLAFCNFFPANITAGNWKIGVVVDNGASDAQAGAVGQILSGTAGGPFADFAPLVGEAHEHVRA